MRDRKDERGAVLAIYTLAIVCVLLFAAIAVDLGNLTQTKQHAQNAADAAALSAVWDLSSIIGGGTTATAEATAVSDVYAYIQHNYSSISTPWGANACPGALPSGITASTQTNCIGFFPSSNPNGIAVAIPGQTVNYSLAKAGGLNGQQISALAEASIQNAAAGYELPYAYPDTGQTGLQCLKTGSGQKADACTGHDVGPGNFGQILNPRYTVYPDTPTGGGQDPVIMANIDLGLDHPLNIYSGSGSLICDDTSAVNPCTGDNAAAPYNTANAIVGETGQNLNESGPGLYYADQSNFTVGAVASASCTITVPRFNHPDGFQANGTCSHDNPTTGPSCPCLSAADSFGSSDTLNGVHVTDFLINSNLYQTCYAGKGPVGDTSPSPSSDPIDKQVVVGGNNVSVWDANPTATLGPASTEDGCLSYQIQQMTTSSPAIFTTSIVQSPRFGIVPVVPTIDGKHAGDIERFMGAFIYDASATSSNKVDAISAWIFPLNLIQTGLVSGPGGGSLYTQGPIVANLCSLATGNC